MGYRGEVEWMNNGNAMIGHTLNRAMWEKNPYMLQDKQTGEWKTWWQNSTFQNAYPGAIPMDDVRSKLLNWEPQEANIAVKLYVPEGHEDAAGVDEQGTFIWVGDEAHKAIVRPDTMEVFGYFGRDSYEVHNYEPILAKCEQIVDTELDLASVFLMDGGAVFVAGMELPDTIVTNEGIAIRPRLQISTSMNGRFKTLFKRVAEIAICSNSFQGNLDGSGAEFKIKHTSKSMGYFGDIMKELSLFYKATEDYMALLDGMTRVAINDPQFMLIASTIHQIPAPETAVGRNGVMQVTNQRAITIAEAKRDRLITMWNSDPQVTPWNGTLFGAFQAFNTWNQWERPTQGMKSVIMGTVTDTFAKQDQEFFDIVAGLDIDLSGLVAA